VICDDMLFNMDTRELCLCAFIYSESLDCMGQPKRYEDEKGKFIARSRTRSNVRPRIMLSQFLMRAQLSFIYKEDTPN